MFFCWVFTTRFIFFFPVFIKLQKDVCPYAFYIYWAESILCVNYSPDLLFLIKRKYYSSSLISMCDLIKGGACFVSRCYWTLKICKYVTESFSMRNLCAKVIVGSISSTLYSFPHSELFFYECINWKIFIRKENTMNLRTVASWEFQLSIWKLP